MEHLPAPPERHHAVHHDDRVPFGECWRCGRDRARCRAKLRFITWRAADDAVRAKNEAEGYAHPVVRYRCRWCLAWHMKTARDKVSARRAERRRRKWLTAMVGDRAGVGPDSEDQDPG